MLVGEAERPIKDRTAFREEVSAFRKSLHVGGVSDGSLDEVSPRSNAVS